MSHGQQPEVERFLFWCGFAPYHRQEKLLLMTLKRHYKRDGIKTFQRVNIQFLDAVRGSKMSVLKVAEHSFCPRFADSVTDTIKRALGLWYANTAVDKVIPQFHMNWIIKLTFDLK